MPEAKDGENKPKSFNSKELQQFDGQEGRPFYVVFKGKVYDLSNSRLWVQGKHMGMHTRNENLSETIKSAPHGEETLARYPIIGELAFELTQAPTPPAVEKKPDEKPVELPVAQPSVLDRRNFLKLIAVAGGFATAMAAASAIKAITFIPLPTPQLSWPKITVTNINQVKPLTPISFNYPLTNTPNILVSLGVTADGGVGPDKDIVAFSDICQHLGCFPGFVAPGGSPPCNSSFKATFSEAYCCCHGSQYDFAHGARVVGGPAPRPVPQVQLEYDAASGNINAVAMGSPTIFGHGPPGTIDPALVMQYDLQGGDIVT